MDHIVCSILYAAYTMLQFSIDKGHMIWSIHMVDLKHKMVHFIKIFLVYNLLIICISEIIICSVSFLVCLERSWRRQRFVKNNSLNQVDPKSEIDDLFTRATKHRSVSHRKYY